METPFFMSTKEHLMTSNLFLQLEEKVENAVETIELLRMQIEELEEENLALKAEHEKWRSDLSALIGRLDKVDFRATEHHDIDEEDYDAVETESEEDEYVSV